MNIYIACGLTHVPRDHFDSYVSFIHSLASNVKLAEHFSVKYALADSDPQLSEKPFADRASLCYLWDRKMVEQSDVVIAEGSFPSTGLGIELQIAETNNIPIIVIFKDWGINRVKSIQYENPDHQKHYLQVGEGIVSLMALGLPNIFKVFKYSTGDEGISLVLKALELLKSS